MKYSLLVLSLFCSFASARTLTEAVLCKLAPNWDLTKSVALINQQVGIPGSRIAVPDSGDPSGTSYITVKKISSLSVTPTFTIASGSSGGIEQHYNNVCVIIEAQ